MFCENVVTLVGWMCKSYRTFSLFNMYCSTLLIYLFILRIFNCLLCTCNVSLHYLHTKSSNYYIHLISSTIHIWFIESLYFFLLLFFFFFKIFFLGFEQVLQCHFGCSSGTVATIATTLFFLSLSFVFFFSFKYLCKLQAYILLYWHNKFYNIFTIIKVSISYKSK